VVGILLVAVVAAAVVEITLVVEVVKVWPWGYAYTCLHWSAAITLWRLGGISPMYLRSKPKVSIALSNSDNKLLVNNAELGCRYNYCDSGRRLGSVVLCSMSA
jgi:hypothetical protein